MQRITIFIVCLLSSGFCLFGQTREIDSLRYVVNKSRDTSEIRKTALLILTEKFINLGEGDSSMKYSAQLLDFLPESYDDESLDSSNVFMLLNLGVIFQFRQLDSAIFFSTKALAIARRIHFTLGEAMALRTLGENYRMSGELPRTLELLFSAVQISRQISLPGFEAETNVFIGIAYNELTEYRTALNFFFEGLADSNAFSMPIVPFALSNVGVSYQKLNMPDSALYFQHKAEIMTYGMNLNLSPLDALVQVSLGQIYQELKQPVKAMGYYHKAIQIHDYLNYGTALYGLADLFREIDQPDSSLYYARLAYVSNQHSTQKNRIIETARLLTQLFTQRKMTDSAFFYQGIVLALRDSLYSPKNFRSLQLTVAKEQQVHYESLQKEEQARNKIKFYGLLATLVVFLTIAMILFRNNRQKQKANVLLKEQQAEVSLQREKALTALKELKATQSLLIHTEKMASLGELTSGIAHEIQNPLNFVNNFSDLNRELINELQEELKKGDIREASGIADSVKENEEKINLHGKRADAIVKSMLQHSRSTSGQKEMTDVNSLVDEYSRLAYMGYRAREQDFNAKLNLDLHPSAGVVPMVTQDIGRVLLNLLNNAFYIVHKKSKTEKGSYEPTISISTYRNDGMVSVAVSDNGNGIPDANRDKIFQPFFTTKPTGQGTGLGLSLSYDIVKAHGGEMKVESKEMEGTIFKVLLPIV